MLGKTFVDFIGLAENLSGTKNNKSKSLLEIDIDDAKWLKFQQKLKSAGSDTIKIKAAIDDSELKDLKRVDGLYDYAVSQSKAGKDVDINSVNSLIQTQNYKNISKQAHGFSGVQKAIDKYNESLKKNDDGVTTATANTDKFVNTLSETNPKLADCMKNANGSSISMKNYAKSLAATTVRTFSLEAATLALNTAMSFGVSIIMTGLITAVDNLIHREERLAEAAETAGDNIKNIKSSFDSLKQNTNDITAEFAELSQHVDQITGKNKDLSTEQYERFLELSNQLAESLPNIGYTIDENGNKITGLTGNFDEITQSINNLVDAERLLSHNEIDQNMDDVFDKALDDLQTYSGELENIKSNSSKFMTDTKEMVTRLLNGERLDFDLNNVTNNQLFSDLKKLFNGAGLNLDAELGGKISLDHTAEWAELSKEELQLLENGADRITHKYTGMANELSESMTDVKNNIQNTLNGLSSYLNSWVTTSFDYNTIIQAYGSDLGTAIQQAINSINWAKIEDVNDWDDAKQWIEENLLAPLKNVQNSDIRKAYIELFTNADIPVDSAISYLEQIEQYYKDNGLEIPVVFTQKKNNIEDVKERFDKKNSSFTSGDTDSLNKFFNDNNIDGEAEYEKWLTATEGITDATEAMEAWNKCQKETSGSSDNSLLSFSEAWEELANTDDDNLKDVTTNLLDLAKAGELTPDTLRSTKEYKELLTKTGLTAEQVAQKINKMVTPSDQLASMGSGIKSLSDNLATKKENPNQAIDYDTLSGMSDKLKENKKEWKNYEKVMGDASSTYEQCRQATNKLAAAFLNNGNYLSNLTKENHDSYISQLKLMGIENAEAIVLETLNSKIQAQNDLEAAAKEKKVKLADASWEQISASHVYKEATEKARVAMQKLYLQECIFQNKKLNLSQKIQELQKYLILTGQADLYEKSAKYANKKVNKDIKAGKYGSGESSIVSEKYQEYQEKYIKKHTQPEIDISTDITPDITGDTGTSDKNSNKSEKSKQTINWISRLLEVLQQKIDKTKASFENLFSLKAKNNNLENQIKKTQKLLNANNRAAQKYAKLAGSVELSPALKTLVKSGDYKISDYDSDTADLISKYQEYIDKAEECKKAVHENITAIVELNRQKLDNITEWYDKLGSKIEANISKLQAQLELEQKINSNLGGNGYASPDAYRDLLNSTRSQIANLTDKRNDYEKERLSSRKTLRKKLKKNGISKKETSAALKQFDAETKAVLAEIDTNIAGAKTSLLDYAEELADIPWEKASSSIDTLKDKYDLLNETLSQSVSASEKNTILDRMNVNAQKQVDKAVNAQKVLKKKIDDIYKNVGADGKNLLTEKELNSIVKKYGADSKKYQQAILYNEYINQYKNISNEIAKMSAELFDTFADNALASLDNISAEYDRKIAEYERSATELNNRIAILEADGSFATGEFYKALAAISEKDLEASKKEYFALKKDFEESLKNGEIKFGTDAYYEGLDALQKVDEAYQQNMADAAKYYERVREAEYELAKIRRESVNDLKNEADFYQGLLDSKELHDDSGKLNDYGKASLSLYISDMGYNIQMIKDYQESLDDLEKSFKNGTTGYEEYTEKQREYTDGIRDAIDAVYDHRDAIKDLIKESYDKQIDSLNDLIDKYTQMLDKEKNLRDYQNSIEDKTSNIASLKKQIEAITGDTTEEARQKLQSLNVELKEAEKDLEETQYDKYISDQKEILQELSEGFEEFVEQQLETVDEFLSQIIDRLDFNGENITQILNALTESFGVKISTELSKSVANITAAMNSAVDKLNKTNDIIKDEAGRYNDGISLNPDVNTTVTDNSDTTDTDSLTGQKIKTSDGADDKLMAQINSLNAYYNELESLNNSISAYENQKNKTQKELTKSMDNLSVYLMGSGIKADGEKQLSDKQLKKIADVLGKGTAYKEAENYNKLIQQKEAAEQKLTNLRYQKAVMNNDIEQSGITQTGDLTTLRSLRTQLIYNLLQDSVTVTPNTLNNYLKQKLGYGISDDNIKYLKEAFGFNGNTSYEQIISKFETDSSMLNDLKNMLKANGYADDGLASVLKKVPGLNGNDGLSTLQKGEAAFDLKQSGQLDELLANLEPLNFAVQGAIDFPKTPEFKSYATDNVSVGNVDIHLDGSNVVDPQSFINVLSNSNEVQKAIQTATVGMLRPNRLNGKLETQKFVR